MKSFISAQQGGSSMHFIMLLLAAVSSNSYAQSDSMVKVDSFVSTGQSTTTAELCGHIEGTSVSTQQILIVTDPKSKGPAKYVALTTPQGEFCSIVATAFGQADVSIIGGTRTQEVRMSVRIPRFTKRGK
jgi:hypothetical protein